MKMELKIERIDKNLELPGYAHEWDAAIDLRSRIDTKLAPMEKTIIPSGIKVAIPEKHVGLIWDRSGMAAKHSMHVLAGVIDSGYRGEIGIVMINLGKKEFEVKKGDRVAQMLIQPVLNIRVKEVEELEKTKRGKGGFGSTGTD